MIDFAVPTLNVTGAGQILEILVPEMIPVSDQLPDNFHGHDAVVPNADDAKVGDAISKAIDYVRVSMAETIEVKAEEACGKVVMENVELTQTLPKPTILEESCEKPREMPQEEAMAEDVVVSTPDQNPMEKIVEKPVIADKVVPVDNPDSDEMATVETLGRIVAENLSLAKTLPRPVVLEASHEVTRDVITMGEAEGCEPVKNPMVKTVEKSVLPGAVTVANDEHQDEMSIVLQALPEGMAPIVPDMHANGAVQPSGIVEVGPDKSSISSVAPSDILLDAANAVADTMMVSPGLMRGEGEVCVRLKPDVLDGAELRIAVVGKSLSVVFEPTTTTTAVLLESVQVNLERQLAMRIHNFEVSVSVRDVVIPHMGGTRELKRRDRVG